MMAVIAAAKFVASMKFVRANVLVEDRENVFVGPQRVWSKAIVVCPSS
jgi:hypothetical protein